MKHAKYIGCLLLILLVSGTALTAQNLLDNQFYREAEQLRQQSRDAIDNEEFFRSIELSRRSQELSVQAYDYAEQLYFAFIARAAKLQAEDLLDLLNRSAVEYNEGEQIMIEDSRAFYNDGVMLFDEEQYELSTLAFLSVIFVLDDAGIPTELAPRIVENEPEPEQVARELPRFYRVRLIPEDRDSFSKIAAYPFIYENYKDWRTLYEKNKDKIVNSENPNLIHPGQLFEIPSIRGEQRDGIWESPSATESGSSAVQQERAPQQQSAEDFPLK